MPKPRPPRLTISPKKIAEVGSSVLKAVSKALSVASPGKSRCKRDDFRILVGGADVIMFDFDGTLTSTPGHAVKHDNSVDELRARAEMLTLYLGRLRQSGIMLGIISKSTEEKIKHALKAANLLHFFNGPVLGSARDFQGKGGCIQDLCSPRQGALKHVGPENMHRIVLVDDDTYQLSLARDCGIQAFAAPEKGGLQERDFAAILIGLCLETPSTDSQRQKKQTKQKSLSWEFNITHCCPHGLTPNGLHLRTEGSMSHFEGDTNLHDFYELLLNERIGKGAFGTCFAARHKGSGRSCAVKRVTLATAPNLYVKACSASTDNCLFGALFKSFNEQSHSNVIRYLDFLFSPDFAYVVMEKLSGPELLAYLEEEAPISEKCCRRITIQLLTALEYIHTSLQLIHRDVKLENLRFRTRDPESDLVLLDFGLACYANGEPGLTSIQAKVGTLLYVAPEVFSKRCTTQSDLWSAGVVVFIILTGRPPWHLKPSQGFHLNQEIASGEAVASALRTCFDAPPLAVELLQGLLHISPDQRFTASASLGHAWFRSPEKVVSVSESLRGFSSANDLSQQPTCERRRRSKSAPDLIKVARNSYARTRLESQVTPSYYGEQRDMDSSWEQCLNLKDSLMTSMQFLNSSCSK